ncbi:agamous-like MADS-box protein AGL62 [Syzygium oleosum]|uniref:agamous-like MADS-box protein AGL62 n=1 Tax=Syzygium oleosum TaxID=219896 RepID=UPI0011D289BA|nr:agamous-like MADS-box protein AGL62 [Syzygium oleosum]
MVLFDLGYMALSLGRPRKQDPRSAADIYSECALESMIVLFGLGNEALSLGRPCCQVSPNRVEDPRASASHAVRQSEGKQRAKLRELSKQNSELSTKPRPTRKCRVELRRELEKCPIKDWWEAPVDQLSLEELKLHKRRYEELSKMLIQAIGDRTADSHSNNSDDPPRTASKGISMSLKCNEVV